MISQLRTNLYYGHLDECTKELISSNDLFLQLVSPKGVLNIPVGTFPSGRPNSWAIGNRYVLVNI